MCRKLALTGWVLQIKGDAEQARVTVALFVSITFFGLNPRFAPLRQYSSTCPRTGASNVKKPLLDIPVRLRSMPSCRQDNRSLATLSHLALILVYFCVLVIKSCNQSRDACSSYGFGGSAEEGVCAHPYAHSRGWLFDHSPLL
eukprot:3855261-Prymnesium_polylepis.2